MITLLLKIFIVTWLGLLVYVIVAFVFEMATDPRAMKGKEIGTRPNSWTTGAAPSQQPTMTKAAPTLQKPADTANKGMDDGKSALQKDFDAISKSSKDLLDAISKSNKDMMDTLKRQMDEIKLGTRKDRHHPSLFDISDSNFERTNPEAAQHRVNPKARRSILRAAMADLHAPNIPSRNASGAPTTNRFARLLAENRALASRKGRHGAQQDEDDLKLRGGRQRHELDFILLRSGCAIPSTNAKQSTWPIQKAAVVEVPDNAPPISSGDTSVSAGDDSSMRTGEEPSLTMPVWQAMKPQEISPEDWMDIFMKGRAKAEESPTRTQEKEEKEPLHEGCLFLKMLPAEIRNLIYSYVLTTPIPIRNAGELVEQMAVGLVVLDDPDPSSNLGIDASLMRTCRKIHAETLPVLYGGNTFFFKDVGRLKTFRNQGLVTTQGQLFSSKFKVL